MNKGFFIDLDGTLLNDKYKICSINKKAINKAKKLGYKIYLVTGKSIKHALKFYKQLKLDTWLVTSSGQVISKDQNIVWQKKLQLKKVNQLINNQNNNVLNDYIIQTNNSIYASNINSPVIKLFYEKNVQIKRLVKNQKISNIVGLYLNLKVYNQEKKRQIVQEFNKKWVKWLEFHPWEMMTNIFIVHVMPAKINKWSAISKIIKWDKITQVITFGNGRNDIPMLKKADWSFAMKNSTFEVQYYAKQVTSFDNNNCGVGKELLKFLNL